MPTSNAFKTDEQFTNGRSPHKQIQDKLARSKKAQLYLWKKRTLFIGRFDNTLDLSQGAATLTIALEKPFSYTTKRNQQAIYCRSLIIPAGYTIKVDTHKALIANCNLDVLGHDYFSLFSLAKDKVNGLGSNLSNEEQLIEDFLLMFNRSLSSHESYQHLDKTLHPKQESEPNLPATDHRIKKVIEYIQNTVNQHTTGEELAQLVNLSIPRLAQLFKQQTGIPIRRYRLWHRLYLTAHNVGSGRNLTDAAIEAGFTDSSHFVRTFRAMLGMSPSCILSQGKNTQIII